MLEVFMMSRSCSYDAGSSSPSADRGNVFLIPDTTSSPWASGKVVTVDSRAPVLGSRVNATSVPEPSPTLPNAIV